MNIKSTALRVIGIIAAILLSFLLVAALIVAPLFSVTASLITPDTVMQVLQKTDAVRDFIATDEPVVGQDPTDEETLAAEMVDAVLGSAVFQETLDAYMADVSAQLRGETPTGAFTEEAIKQIATRHRDELATLVSTYVPEAAELTEQEFDEAMNEVIDNYASSVFAAVPTGEELQQALQESDLAQPLSILASPIVPLILYGAVALLAALIFVCLLHRFGGMLCLGIDTLIAALPLAAVAALLGSGWLLSVLEVEAGGIAHALLSVLGGKLSIAAAVLALVGILLIVGYILYNRLVFNKKPATNAASIVEEAAPVEL